VLTLFAALCFEVLSLFQLRRASSIAEAELWIDPVPNLPLATATSAVVIFFSGGYLAMQMAAFELAWIKVAIAALLLIAPLGALTGRRMRALRESFAKTKTIDPEVLRCLQDPFLKVSLSVRIAIFFGIVLLMAAKPEMWESIAVVGQLQFWVFYGPF